VNPDSLDLLDKAKETQARFERYREQRIPPEIKGYPGGCDDLIGRFCLRFGNNEDENEWEVPEEPVEFGMARVKVLNELAEISKDIPGDSWILGQRVYYMGEVGNWQQAEALIRRCRGEQWWCTALLGYVKHAQGDWEFTAEIFERALEQMPPEVAISFRTPTYLLDPGAMEVYETFDDRNLIEDRLWTLSDPLYIVQGNDRKTEQYARQVLIRMRREAVNAYGVSWADDIEELTIRYGAEKAWERIRGVVGQGLQDTRSIVGRHNPKSQEFLPPKEGLEDPAQIAPDDWTLGKIRPWTGYAPPYAPDLNQLETQVARFRRGDSLLVVGAFAPETDNKPDVDNRRTNLNPRIVNMRPSSDETRAEKQSRLNPFGRNIEKPQPFLSNESTVMGPVKSGLFLIDTKTGENYKILGEGPEGAFQLQVKNGRYIVGIEAFSEDTKQAWRDRHGIWQEDIVPGLAVVSDLLILKGGGGLPKSLDEALPKIMPAVHIRSGAAFQVAWELYGLRIGESASVRIGVDQGGEGLLRQLGQFLRVLEPDAPVVMEYEEAGPDVLGTLFRAVQLNLPDLEPGEYTLTVEIELSGREPMSVARPIIIVP
tara:strand:+ start:12264 stop:14054 length:1791 start_codon:yes stop_codon:yes gene_type:complete